MAKSKTKTEQIEEAVVVEETTNALTVAENIASNLPVIPEVFFIDGEEFSVAKVQELQKEAEALLKKATPETYNSTTIWEEVKALKNRLVKMRTTPDNKRKELSKPFQDFVKEIKSKTDLVGDAAKSVQEKLDEALIAKENHEAEIARQEAEAKAKRTEQRKESLRALGGSYDVDGGKFTFGYAPAVVVSDMQIMEYDDPSWNNQYNQIKTEWDEEQSRIASQAAKEEAEKQAALDAANAAVERVLKLRKKLLDLNGFEFNEGLQSYVKGDQVIHVLSVKSFSDEDFDNAIEEVQPEVLQDPAPHVTPGDTIAFQAPVTPPAPPQANDTVPATPTGNATNVFAQFQSTPPVVKAPDPSHTEDLGDNGDVVVLLRFNENNPFIDTALSKTFMRLSSATSDYLSLKF